MREWATTDTPAALPQLLHEVYTSDSLASLRSAATDTDTWATTSWLLPSATADELRELLSDALEFTQAPMVGPTGALHMTAARLGAPAFQRYADSILPPAAASALPAPNNGMRWRGVLLGRLRMRLGGSALGVILHFTASDPWGSDATTCRRFTTPAHAIDHLSTLQVDDDEAWHALWRSLWDPCGRDGLARTLARQIVLATKLLAN